MTILEPSPNCEAVLLDVCTRARKVLHSCRKLHFRGTEAFRNFIPCSLFDNSVLFVFWYSPYWAPTCVQKTEKCGAYRPTGPPSNTLILRCMIYWTVHRTVQYSIARYSVELQVFDYDTVAGTVQYNIQMITMTTVLWCMKTETQSARQPVTSRP